MAVDNLAVLCDRHVDAEAALSIDQFDGLRHGVGIFAAVRNGQPRLMQGSIVR
jgi:hypothetical protein